MSRMPKFTLLLALLVGAAVAPGAACAAPRAGGAGETGPAPQALVLPGNAITAAVRRTAVADPDLDGEVTGAESAQYYETRFSLLDENRDGSVDELEFVRAVAVRSLSVPDSFARPRSLAFESVDVDGNGKLTPEEFLRAEVLRRRASASAGVDSRRRAIFQEVDGDGDGLLSEQEFTEGGRREFRDSDADGDGKVTIWEFYGGARL